MGLVDDELADIKSHCERAIDGSKVVACVPAQVRIDFRDTKHKRLTVCCQFPPSYPKELILLELKSKTLSQKLLAGLTTIAENEAKQYLGKPQIFPVLRFIRKFINDNPLCVCSDEISVIKSKLSTEDELKLKQKTSSVMLKVNCNQYYLSTKIFIPNDYPEKQVRIEDTCSNFPNLFQRWFSAQSIELARQCVEPPIKTKPKAPPFEPRPSLQTVTTFLISEVKRYPEEVCQACGHTCLPSDPKDVVEDETSDRHIERVYCGHLFHLGCFFKFMKTPPFQGGKCCPKCKVRIYHEKYKVTPQLAEARWAHKQAKDRELGEVIDFLNS